MAPVYVSDANAIEAVPIYWTETFGGYTAAQAEQDAEDARWRAVEYERRFRLMLRERGRVSTHVRHRLPRVLRPQVMTHRRTIWSVNKAPNCGQRKSRQ